MHSQDREKCKDWRGEKETKDWDEGREGERERRMGTQKLVQRSNYGKPGHRRQCRSTCTHTLRNTLWSTALSQHGLAWWRERQTRRTTHERTRGQGSDPPSIVYQYSIKSTGRAELKENSPLDTLKEIIVSWIKGFILIVYSIDVLWVFISFFGHNPHLKWNQVISVITKNICYRAVLDQISSSSNKTQTILSTYQLVDLRNRNVKLSSSTKKLTKATF